MAIWSNGQHLTLVLVLLTVFYTVGIFIFTRGFLLNRLVVPKYSSCHDGLHNISSLFSHEESFGDCWMKARFKKAVIIVIDALRYDFMLYNESLVAQDTKSHQNKLKVIYEVLKEKPGHGKLFMFVADPPTTTMQRIKGLTTGSLPTFIDAGSNFASSEIIEDNIISQLKSIGKNLVFIGDDTWMGLFPNSFKRSYPFPSFNVKDLHTVDNGVIAHLIPEIRTNDWDIIIAHFLGVDHCGHRYGPYHPAMAEKLLQMDYILKSVINEVDNETLLLVFGDHGMTKTGDHGGDSIDEVQAGLFVYSSTKSFVYPQLDHETIVSQVDIVPTLSLLLGAPIPFPNLGIVITSLFERQDEKQFNLQALQLNARQVHRYLTQYSKLSNDISSSALMTLTELFMETEEYVLQNIKSLRVDVNISKNLSIAASKYLVYLKEVRELCRSIWARFDLAAITAGISIVFFSCLVSVLVLIIPKLPQDLQIRSLLTGYSISGSLAIVVLFGFLLNYGYLSMLLAMLWGSLGISVIFYKVLFNIVRYFCHLWHLKDFVVRLVLCLYFLVFFSNSFVVHEGKVVLFFLQTLFLICIVDILRSSHFSRFVELDNLRTTPKTRRKLRDSVKKQTIGSETMLKLFTLVILLVLTRLGQLLWSCREEQLNCESIFKPTNLAPDKLHAGYQSWISPLLLCLVPASLLLRLKSSGNLIGNSCTVLAVKYALPLGACFACVHWFLQCVPAKMLQHTPGIGFLQQILAPCIVYISCVLTLVCLLYKPLMIYFAGTYDIDGETTDSTRHRPAANAVVEIFKRLCSEMGEKTNEKNEKLPIIYGLGTMYSSAIFICLVCFSLPIAIVLGDGPSSSVTFMLAHIYGFLELHKILEFNETDTKQSSGSLAYSVITWFIMSSHYFFTSGHQATIPSIRFEAAFVGLPGNMENIFLPGVLIMLNTFGSDIIFAISLPLVIFWSNQFRHDRKSDDINDRNKAEFVYAEDPGRLRSEAFRVCALYQLCKGLKLLGTMLAAAVHRRHLMVWKIFAPRFIFEGVSFILTSVMLILVYCFILRVNHAVQSWLRTLQNTD